MQCPIKVAETTSNELRALADYYPVSLESLLRASLDFVAVVMEPGLVDQVSNSATLASAPVILTATGLHGGTVKRDDEAVASPQPVADDLERPATPAPPDFIGDFCGRVLRASTMRPEIHRVSAIMEDTVLNLRAQRLRLEAVGRVRGPGRADKRRVDSFIEAAATVPEDRQYVRPETLGLLQAVKEFRLAGRLVPTSCLPVAGSGVKSPGFPDWEHATQQGLTLTRTDLERWLPVLHHYGWVPLALTLGEPLRAADADVVMAGFSRYLSLLAEAVCFLFSVTPNLRRKAYREDLLVIHLRAQHNTRALEQRLLEIEAGVHRINLYLDPLTEAALILAPKPEPEEPIVGADVALPALVATGGAPQPEPSRPASAVAAVTYLPADAEVV